MINRFEAERSTRCHDDDVIQRRLNDSIAQIRFRELGVKCFPSMTVVAAQTEHLLVSRGFIPSGFTVGKKSQSKAPDEG